MGKGRTPKVDAMVLCRAVEADEAHTRYSLLDIVRGRIEGAEFPLRLPGLYVYVSLTGMHGTYEVVADLVSLASGLVVRESAALPPRQIDDPLKVVTLVQALPELEFPDRGRYACRLLVNGSPAHEVAFDVDWPKPPSTKGTMSAASFARAIQRIRDRNPSADDAMLARVAGVEPEVLTILARDPRGIPPALVEAAITRLATHFRMRPEEFFDKFP